MYIYIYIYILSHKYIPKNIVDYIILTPFNHDKMLGRLRTWSLCFCHSQGGPVLVGGNKKNGMLIDDSGI